MRLRAIRLVRLFPVFALLVQACSGGGGGGGTPAPTYSISGTITKSTTGALAGATVSLSGASSATTVTDATGKYTFSGLTSGGYTVGASLVGWVFAPQSIGVSVSGASVTGRDFVATANANPHAISGTISKAWGGALAGVTVTLGGANTGSAITNASGAYTFSGLADGSYTVTATLAGWSFTPTGAAAVVVSGSNQTQDFTADGAYTIAGNVTKSWGGALSGVSVAISGGGIVKTAQTTDGSGHYAIAGVPPGTYTITPTLAGWSFTPAAPSVSVTTADVTRDFAADGAYTISGTISGAAVAGVTLTLADTGGSGVTKTPIVTGAAGTYAFTGIPAGSYTVTPSLADHIFTPDVAPITVTTADVTQDFSDVVAVYQIVGHVSGGPAAGVTVRLSGASTATTRTDAGGAYSLGVQNGQEYTVTPSMEGYTFTPDHVTTTIAALNTTVDFTASSAGSNPEVTINGSVTYGGSKTGRVFLVLRWQNQGGGESAAGTSLSGPGAFSLHAQAQGPLPQTATLLAYMDTQGTDVCVAGADPIVVQGSINVNSTTVDVGALALQDPSAMSPSAPQLQAAIPVDKAVALIWNGQRDAGSGCEIADHYRIYWSATAPNPSSSSKDGYLDVPAGPDFGVVENLTNYAAKYFSVAARVGSSESAPVTFTSSGTPQSVAPGVYTVVGGHNITGTVTFAAPGAASSLFLYAQQSNSNGPTALARVDVAAGQTSANYSLSVPSSAIPYGIGAFLDLGNKGFVSATDPGSGGDRVPAALVTVGSTDVAASTIALPSSAAVTVAAQHDDWGGGNSGDSLQFSVTPALKNVVAARVTAGPNVIVPIDLGVSDHGGPGMSYSAYRSLYPTSPVVGDAYTVNLTYSDGTTSDVVATVSAVITSTPTGLSPANGTTTPNTTPTFTWTAPSSPPSGTYYYYVEVYPMSGGNGWQYGPIPSSSALSVATPVLTGGGTLAPATQYQYRVSVLDANGNEASSQVSFTTP